MNIQRIAAFSDNNAGGNPAGVVLCDALPSRENMQATAAKVGYSETVFASPDNDGWKVRYFSPESEVPFCGHATIALGAALAREHGNGVYHLALSETNITVEGNTDGVNFSAALLSPPTQSKAIEDSLKREALELFSYTESHINPSLPMALIHGGANHLVIGLSSREALASMHYDLERGRELMNNNNLVTILLAYAETPQLFHTRNPFASGGVYEDPATGAATAALAGYLRDINWPHAGTIDIVQGEDMGSRSLINAQLTDEIGSAIRVSGTARLMGDG